MLNAVAPPAFVWWETHYLATVPPLLPPYMFGRRGITVPVVPGMMCINAYGGFKKMIGFCCTRVPPKVMAKMEEIKVRRISIRVDEGRKA